MNGANATSPRTVALGVHILLWVWLVVLSILVGTGHRTMAGLADRAHVDSSQRQVQVLQARIAELADSVHMLETQPEFATVAVLHETRQRLETRLTRMEQTLADRSAAEEFQALRTEVEQMKARSQPIPTAPPPQAQPHMPVATAPKQARLPFRIIGSEMRAGQHKIGRAHV